MYKLVKIQNEKYIVEDTEAGDITEYNLGDILYCFNQLHINIQGVSLVDGYVCILDNQKIKHHSRLGERRMMNCGMYCTIVDYISSRKITFMFKDNTVVSNRAYRQFNKCGILNQNIKGYRPTLKSKLGETKMQNCGMRCTVIEYFDYYNITVRFEDGTVVTHRKYRDFKNGGISNPNLDNIRKLTARLGETKMQNCGMRCTIIEYIDNANITVRFEDGTVVSQKRYYNFKKGYISNPNLENLNKVRNRKARLGETEMQNCGMKCTIIEYMGVNNITVRFEDGTVVTHRRYDDFKRGTILNHNMQENLYNHSLREENIVYRYIKSIFPDAQLHYRPDWLKNKDTGFNMEIDIWIPKLKIGIEYDDKSHLESNLFNNNRLKIIDKKYKLIQQSDEIKSIIVLSESPSNYIYQIDKGIYHLMPATMKHSNFKEVSLLPTIQWLFDLLNVNRKVSINDRELYSDKEWEERQNNTKVG